MTLLYHHTGSARPHELASTALACIAEHDAHVRKAVCYSHRVWDHAGQLATWNVHSHVLRPGSNGGLSNTLQGVDVKVIGVHCAG